MKIEWKACGAIKQGYTTTKAGIPAIITSVQQTTVGSQKYSLYIAGDKKNACTRATLEKINQILNER